MTVPVEMPGELVSLGFSAQFRARSDEGPDPGRRPAPTAAGRGERWPYCRGRLRAERSTFRVEKWPAKTRKVLLRFEMTGNNTAGVQSFRVDADYRDPMAAKHGSSVSSGSSMERGRSREGARRGRLALADEVYDPSWSEPEMVSVGYEMEGSR